MNVKSVCPLVLAVLGTFAIGCSGSSGGGTLTAQDDGGSTGAGNGGNGNGNGGNGSTGADGGETGGDSGTSGGQGTDDGGDPTGTRDGGTTDGATGSTGTPSASFVFSPYKDTGINMNWNTNVISTNVSGTATPLGTDLSQMGGKTITLAFATGECGTENWGGVAGADMATANVSLLTQAGIKYIVSTGGEAGSFTCGTDSGMATFLGRWASTGLIGVDFDIEAGQSQDVINALIARIQTAHGTYPNLRFSLTLGVLAASQSGSSTAQSLGANAVDVFNVYGDDTLGAVKSTLGFTGTASTWPSYLTVNLMTMDYGGASASTCVVSGTLCEMGQSAIQAAYDIHDKWGVPYTNLELTPMLGGNDVSSEQFTLRRRRHDHHVRRVTEARRGALLVVRPRRGLRDRAPLRPRATRWGRGTPARTAT